jgi:putative ABC transport system permease protein
MFLRLLIHSFLRQGQRTLLAGAAVVLGTAIVTSMVAVSAEIGDKMNAEIRSLGANIVVYPQEDSFDVQVGGIDLKPASDGAYLNESELVRIKQIFWAHNVRGYTPILESQVRIGDEGQPVPIVGTYFAKAISLPSGVFYTGVTKTHGWWHVEGDFPADDSRDVLLGHRLAARLGFKPGDLAYIADRETRVSGILTTGGSEEDAIVAPIGVVQHLIGRPGAVRRVYISALTKPEDDFARRDPSTMSPEMLERWSCSPYANSIAYQIGQAIPNARAEQIRAVAQNEGVLLSRISGLMWLVAIGAVTAASLAVAASTATTMLERRPDVGLMRSLGADRFLISGLFFAEAALIALVGGSFGFLLGELLAQRISIIVFGSGLTLRPELLPVVWLIAALVTFLGSAASIRRSVRMQPSLTLRGDGA